MIAIVHAAGACRHGFAEPCRALARFLDGLKIRRSFRSNVARRDGQRMAKIFRSDDIGQRVVARGLNRLGDRERKLFQRLAPKRVYACDAAAGSRRTRRSRGCAGHISPFCPEDTLLRQKRQGRVRPSMALRQGGVPDNQARSTRTANQARDTRSEEHTSELQSLMRISYAVFCLKKKKNTPTRKTITIPHTTQHNKTIKYI